MNYKIKNIYHLVLLQEMFADPWCRWKVFSPSPGGNWHGSEASKAEPWAWGVSFPRQATSFFPQHLPAVDMDHKQHSLSRKS